MNEVLAKSILSDEHGRESIDQATITGHHHRQTKECPNLVRLTDLIRHQAEPTYQERQHLDSDCRYCSMIRAFIQIAQELDSEPGCAELPPIAHSLISFLEYKRLHK